MVITAANPHCLSNWYTEMNTIVTSHSTPFPNAVSALAKGSNANTGAIINEETRKVHNILYCKISKKTASLKSIGDTLIYKELSDNHGHTTASSNNTNHRRRKANSATFWICGTPNRKQRIHTAHYKPIQCISKLYYKKWSKSAHNKHTYTGRAHSTIVSFILLHLVCGVALEFCLSARSLAHFNCNRSKTIELVHLIPILVSFGFLK